MLSEEDVIARAPKIRNQLFVRARTLNMRRSMFLPVAVVLTLLSVDALALEGVKGGHRSHRPDQSGGINSTILGGRCYKTLPYAEALALNSTGKYPHNTLPSAGESSATNGLITILDCCDGYERNVTSGGCDPQCVQGCLGGRCTAPNECTCEPGWFPQEGICKPYCEGPCQQYAYCFSPNECACQLGYDEVNGECLPICPGGCKNGDCVAPRVCKCKRGFTLQSFTDSSGFETKRCVPTCEHCRNGECTAPGECSCREGYTNPPGNSETCVPSCPDGCLGGECVSPGNCNCRPSYTFQFGKCVPECPQGCPNGECVAPSRCNCNPGFAFDANGNCVPVCPKGCLNGECVAPGNCTCSPGFTLDPTNTCVPDCPRGCPNGECVAPGACTCKRGFTYDSRGNCVSIFMAWSGSSQTNSASQTNSTSQTNSASQTSNINQTNGACNPGSVFDPDTSTCVLTQSKYRCRNGCGSQGYCVAPDMCICNYGMTPDPVTGRCPELRPVNPTNPVPALCRYGCGSNGQCVGPNRCACNPGFVNEPDTGVCVPSNPTSEPICENPCINGDCTGLNQCTCKRGYAMSLHDPTRTRCVPVCVGGCPNGVCSGPNLCICNIGYRKETGVKGRQRCVPSE